MLKIRITTTAPLREVLPLRAGLRRALPRIADSMSRGVRDRTASGRDTRGRRFAPKADGSPSRLTDTGRMVASFGTASMRPAGFTLGPGSREHAKAGAHQTGARGLPRREWIGVSRRQIDQAVEQVATAEFGGKP